MCSIAGEYTVAQLESRDKVSVQLRQDSRVDDVTDGTAVSIMTAIAGMAAGMKGTIGAGMRIVTANGASLDRIGGTGSGIEIDRRSNFYAEEKL